MRFLRNLAVATIGGLATTAALADLPVGQSFTFQGNLVLNDEIVNQACDFEFRLYDDAVAGNQVGATLNLNNEDVVAGTFTTLLDFGAQFNSKARFLEIAVRCPAGVGAFTTLNPRQELTAAPYALGLALPFQAVTDSNLGGAFEIVNNDMGWAGVFRNNNPANADAALNVTSMGGPAGQFFNDAGGQAVNARGIGNADAIYAESSGGRGVYSLITSVGALAPATAVRGENLSLQSGTSGVWGSSDGSGYGVRGTTLSGRGVFGEGTGDFAFGVYGSAAKRTGIGVYGIHQNATGQDPGVDGVTLSIESGAAGVRGRATGQTSQGGITYGVLGTSISATGVGVRGESQTGVEGDGTQYGVFGTSPNIGGYGVRGEATYGVYGLGDDGGAGVTGVAGNSSTIGVHAIGADNRLGAPALRADAGNNGVGIYSLAGRAIEGEGTEFGVRGVTWDQNGVGGTFTNYSATGVALSVNGRAEVNGTMAVDVLEIMGGADLAERFLFSEDAQPGMVVAIDPDVPGQMEVSRSAYNTRVAGVISGANELAAGVVLGDEPGHSRNLPVALSGRVWVQVDTRDAGVNPGDFMTTSDLAGFAMPVTDRDRAEGAVIGKAMTALAQGESGMVLVLVNLQ